MADIDLPVFSFAPNWQGGVVERLEWLTDVLRSMLGYEQRRALRLTPRRYFEADFNLIGNERSFLALWMQRFAEQEFLMPLWHDRAKLTSAAAATAVRINFDNTYREFVAGGLAILRNSAFSYEVVEITTMDAGGIDLAVPLVNTWAAGKPIHPLRPAVLDDPSERISAIIDRVGDAALTFRCSRANPYASGAETLVMYEGYPVVSIEPNRVSALTAQFERMMEDLDSLTGLVFRRDEAGRAFATQFYNWQARGRQQHHELRQTLYRLWGRQKAAWMPTFNRDVVLARPLAVGASHLDIQEIGFEYLGGPVSGREHIMLRDSTGVRQIVKVTGTVAPLGSGEERLVLSAVTAFDAPVGQVGSFAELMRMDQDIIEFTHHTDSDGAAEVEAAFKAFQPGRTTAGTLVLPHPVAVQTGESCGGPGVGEDGPCLAAGFYVGGKAVLVQSLGEHIIPLTDLTGGIAAAPSAGDLIIVSFGLGTAGNDVMAVVTAGYTEVAELYDDDAIDANLSVNYKVSDGDVSVEVDTTSGLTESQPGVCAIHVWRGISAASPMDVAATTATGINTGRPNPAAILPVSEGAIIIVVGLGAHFGSSLPVFTAPELSNFVTVAGAGPNNSAIGLGSREWTGGSFDPSEFGGGSTSTNSSWAAVTLALRLA